MNPAALGRGRLDRPWARAYSTEEAQTQVAVAIAQQVADLLLRGVVRHAVNAHGVDPELLRELAPYLALAVKLGSFLGQLAEGRMAEARLTYAGEIASHAAQPLTVTLLRGLGRVGTVGTVGRSTPGAAPDVGVRRRDAAPALPGVAFGPGRRYREARLRFLRSRAWLSLATRSSR